MVELSSFPAQSIALVQGASRGIGLEFVRQLLESGRFAQVYAASRAPRQSRELAALGEDYSETLRTLALDVTREDAVRAAAEKVAFDVERLHPTRRSPPLFKSACHRASFLRRLWPWSVC